MPFTHVEIEERKTRRIALLVLFLVLLYFASAIVLVEGASWFAGYPVRETSAFFLVVLGGAAGVAGLHWGVSTHQLTDRVLASVFAKPIDPGDTYHLRLKNIIEEVSVATGGRYRVEPYVIPTTAMNACAVADFEGRAAIAVTEGLLARLNRAQLEGVIGHEAAHIASGDSLANSVFCGLFALHEEGLKRLGGLFDDQGVELRGRGAGLILFIMAVLWVTTRIKRFCELMVSREQEYRADAVAVRLTRDPLGLAEALRVISTRWRGVGSPGASLSTIFILDPGEEYLSEREGLVADWFSTHPPTPLRINALLEMAHLSPEAFEQSMAERPLRPRVPVPSEPAAAASGGGGWWLSLDGQWMGPMSLEALLGQRGLTPESWVRREGEEAAKLAYQEPALLAGLQARYGGGPAAGRFACPRCRMALSRVQYEGVPLDQCPACRGCYVMPEQMSRVLARQDYAFPESIVRLAKALPAVRSTQRIAKQFQRSEACTKRAWTCPACQSMMLRQFYTEAYLVEVVRCWVCGLTWLEKDQLELLQYLYEEGKVELGDTP